MIAECLLGVFDIIPAMGGKYEVVIEKTERVCVVVEAEDVNLAHIAALEAERRGEIASAEDVTTRVVACKCCDFIAP